MSLTPTDFLEQLTAPAPRAAATLKTENPQELATTLLDKHLRVQAGPETFDQTARVAAHYSRAVDQCRQGLLVVALDQLQRTDELLPTLSAAARELVTLYQLSGWGYYYYKVREGEQGVELLRRGLTLSADLERRGYPSLIYRRMEQLQNIATIYAQQQRYDEANELVRNTLAFIHAGQAQGLLIDDWDAAAMQRVRLFQEFVLDASFSNLAAQNTAQMENPAYGNDYYYRFFFQRLLRELQTDTYNRVVLFNWMYVKASYFEQGPDAFLENTLTFVTDAEVGPEYDVFRANLLAQVIWHLRRQPQPPQAVIEAICDFAQANLTDRRGKAIRMAA